MKVAKQQLLISSIFVGLLLGAIVYSQFGYFRTVEEVTSKAGTDKKLENTLRAFSNELKLASSPKDLEKVIKNVDEEFKVLGGDRKGDAFQAFESFRKHAKASVDLINGPSHLADKKVLMEGLVNAYRKEIPDGPIALRAAYLNFLFDVQQSLLSTSIEVEEVSIQKMKERLSSLKSIVDRSGESALKARLGVFEDAFSSLERRVSEYRIWSQSKSQSTAELEKRIPKLAISIGAETELQNEDMRSTFLLASLLVLFSAVLCGLAMFLSYKFGKIRFEARKSGFLNFIATFGNERLKDEDIENLKILQMDPDWGEVVKEALRSEGKFINTYQTLISVPQSMKIPLGFFSRDGVLDFQNSELEQLMATKAGDSLKKFLDKNKIYSREGDPEAVVAMIENSFASPKTDVFEIAVSWEGKSLQYELLSFPVTRGPLAGGKVFLFREIRNELVRIENSVREQIEVLRSAISNVVRGQPINPALAEQSGPEVRTCLGELDSMVQFLSEQELRRRAERDGMLDQIEKQSEVLQRLSKSMLETKNSREEAKRLMSEICESDENWYEEVRTIEREMERWLALRERLETELGRYADVVERAKAFEKSLAKSVSGLANFVGNYQSKMNDLNEHYEQMRIHASNMSFVSDPKLREIASFGRAYVEEMNKFISIAEAIGGHIQLFLEQHPASGPASTLSAYSFDAEALESFDSEEAKIGNFVKRWSSAGQELLKQEENAKKVLSEMESQLATMLQLGETSLVINNQTKGNLARFL